MSAALIWIVIPFLIAAVLLVLQRWERLVPLVGTLLAIGLAWAAWQFPIGEAISIGPLAIRISPTYFVLGRQLVLENGIRPSLVLVYLAAAFWFGGAYVARAGRAFVPLALANVSVLTAALAVTPFLYAALLIELAALLSIPILSAPGKRVERGAIRFLIFQTLGMPCILFTGWMLAGIDTSPGDSALIGRASLLIAIGFAFLLAIFPFHSWIPMIMDEAHPYAAAFVLLILPGMVSFFGLGFLNRYAWLRSSDQVYFILRFAGAIMVVGGGLLAALQDHLGKILGYAMLVEIGLSLSALGLQGSPSSLGIFFALILPRGLALGVWALALSTIRFHASDLRFSSVQGLARRLPLASVGLVVSNFTLAGFPILAGFPARLALWEELAQKTPLSAFWALLGSAALLAAGIRSLAALVTGSEGGEQGVHQSFASQVLILLGMSVLLLVGLFPQWFLPSLARIPPALERLIP